MREQVKPNSGDTRGHRDAFFVDKRCQRGSVTHFVTGHHHLGARYRAGVGVTPGVNVEHRHDW